MRTFFYARVPEDPILTYEAYMEEHVGKQYVYLMLDKAAYHSHKCDANLSDVYQQEIILRDEMLRLVRYRKGIDPLNPLYDMQIQILEKDMSRYRYLLDELNDRLSLSKTWICR